ncbi:MAG TPA: ABC transporter permease, partial [Anaerolineales bacterium]|nr:ABC transporter permease [Anaerolineales bacterium]
MRSKFWYVAVYEFKRHVLKKRFLLAVFSVPLVLGASFLAGYVSYIVERNLDPLGYVDMAGILADPLPVPEDLIKDDAVDLIPYATDEEAKAALKNETIQAYYVIPPGYQTSREVFLVYSDEPGENAEDYFFTFLQVNVSAGLPEKVLTRALDGFDLTLRDPEGSRQFNSDQILNILLPVILGFVFTFVLTTGSGYFANAVSEEKENRTIEVLATSMSANQFILGKVLGIVMVIFTQVTSWLL